MNKFSELPSEGFPSSCVQIDIFYWDGTHTGKKYIICTEYSFQTWKQLCPLIIASMVNYLEVLVEVFLNFIERTVAHCFQ